MSDVPVLEVEDLSVMYAADSQQLAALRSVDLALREGEMVGVVGESGCGKSTLSLALMGLLPANGAISSGAVRLGGDDLAQMDERRLRAVRGSEMAMIFQDPSTSLNPTFTIGSQVTEVLRAHPEVAGRKRQRMEQHAGDALERVGLPDAQEILRSYPHQLSGGMQQRVMIALALTLRPSVLIADEPTSALDVTLQAQIVGLLQQLCQDYGTGILLISHDLGLVSSVCDRVLVMYGGEIMESATGEELFSAALHPYTRALLHSVPSRRRRDQALEGIPGKVPALADLPSGCVFADRCPHRRPICEGARPALVDVGERRVRCKAYDPDSGYGEPPSELARALGDAQSQ